MTPCPRHTSGEQNKSLYIQEDAGMLLFITVICGWLTGCQSSESTGGRGSNVGDEPSAAQTGFNWNKNFHALEIETKFKLNY